MSQSDTDNFNLFADMSDADIERFLLDSVDTDLEMSDDDHLLLLDDSIANTKNESFDDFHLTDNKPQSPNPKLTGTQIETNIEANPVKASIYTIDISATNASDTNNDLHDNNVLGSGSVTDIDDNVFKLDETLLLDSIHLEEAASLSDEVTDKPYQSKELDNSKIDHDLPSMQQATPTDTFDNLSNDYIFDNDLPLDNLDSNDIFDSETIESNILEDDVTRGNEVKKDEAAVAVSDFDIKTNEINADMKQFLQKMHEIARHSDEFHKMSSKLIEDMRNLQIQESEDDFSITYEQIYQLRGCMLVARRAFNEIPNFYDMVEQAWENDLYTAQMRQKHKK